ncbi:MAG: RluA family pseudouridine synthase [Methylococcaceae bacterium]|nr:RluA family pseudouridine synthase [Methylococcaceae bacterium]MCI0733656.1 RluA family pseudouridine synthase [Methylococcaceae bacterium]
MSGVPDPNSKSRLLEISEVNAAQRIDNFLISRLKGVPRSRIYRMIRTGEVRVNRGRARAEYRLKTGDLIRIPPVRIADSSPRTIATALLENRLVNRILYEDADLLAINKPSGIAVHGGTGLSFGLIEGLRELRGAEGFFELVHRLDRDTSGCLLIAKNRSALNVLHDQFRSDRIRKSYTALLAGVLPRKKVTVDQPLRKNTKRSGEWIAEISTAGKASRTDFIRKSIIGDSTLVAVFPETGRTHQIRVHAAYSGFPVAGDERYGNADYNRRVRKLGLKRLFLHASSLEFKHPGTGTKMRIDAPLDDSLSGFLETLAREQSL